MRYSAVTFGGSEMVSHKRLQQYKRYYGKTLMTGLYGCRWHRYQQSRDNTSIVSINFVIVLFCEGTSIYVIFRDVSFQILV